MTDGPNWTSLARMTSEDVVRILGPELAAEIASQPSKPLTSEQVDQLVAMFEQAPQPARTAAA